MDVVGREPGATRNGRALQLLDEQSADVFVARASPPRNGRGSGPPSTSPAEP